MELLIILFTGLLSYSNGANDISKGIATLVGSGVSSLQSGLLLGTLATAAGVFAATRFSSAMVETFTAGISTAGIPVHLSLLAIVIGATLWVAFATRTGMPVSTTHAITGSMLGVMVFSGDAVHGSTAMSFVAKIVMPLFLSPMIAFALVYFVNSLLRPRLHQLEMSCICMTDPQAVVAPILDNPSTAARRQVTRLSRTIPAPLVVFMGPIEDCASSPRAVGLRLVDTAHYISAGFTSFARGLNDAPKILPFLLLLPSIQISPLHGYIYIALAMALGGLIAGRRVVDTMSTGITPVSPSDGFLANMTTSILVGSGAWFGLPMSTTHVSTSAIAGAGQSHGRAVSWETVRHIAIAWIVTVPVSGLLALGAVFVIRLLIS